MKLELELELLHVACKKHVVKAVKDHPKLL